MKKLNLLTFLSLFLSLHALAQDKIYKKNGEVIEATIVEIGETEIKYKLFNDLNGPTYVLDKDRLKKTVYQNGREETYFNSLKDISLYADQSKNAIKVNFLSPLFGFTQISFERSLKPGRSFELTLGIIGLGKRQAYFRYDNYNSSQLYRGAAGAFVTGGYKFLTLPNFIRSGDKYSHVLQGWYAKPEAILGVYSQNTLTRQNIFSSSSSYQQSVITGKETIAMGALILNLGKQWVLGDAFLIDVYGGIGYALASNNRNYNSSYYYYDEGPGNHFALSNPEGSGVGLTGGLKIGLLLNKKKK
jgi:hypothetical protein